MSCDADIRPFLRRRLELEHAGEHLLILDEFPIYGGDVRADMVAMNGSIHGYEIKSDRDKLTRLPRQVDAYGAVFDRASIVLSESHLEPARAVLPDWWEILIVQCVGGGVCFRCLRRGRSNPSREGRALTALLWKSEAMSLLVQLGLDSGMRSATMSDMMDKLAENVSVRKLSVLVRQSLLARGDWLAASRQKRSDAKSQPPATRAGRRRTLYSRTSG
jgi:hypothetical protein